MCNHEPERVNVIAREYSYHGNTLGALAAGWNPPRRDPYAPMLSPAFHHAPRCFYSRDAESGEDESDYVARIMDAYEQLFQRLNPATVAAVIVEPVVGATLGSVAAATGYLSCLRKLCDRHGALLIYDEVMCGMGRTGTAHAWQSLDGPSPDLQTIGKGLAAGYQPVSAVLISGKVSSRMHESSSSRVFLSGHTYQAHAIGCAAAIAVQKTMQRDSLLDNVREMGAYLVQQLSQHIPQPLLKEIRGVGLFQTVEFSTAQMGTAPVAAEVAALTFEKGAAVYLCSSAVDAILFAPPFIITKHQVDELVKCFIGAVLEVFHTRGIKS
jgi:adenosylmethionine-8-amino-7-oxononanoate aminotransferase